jgi:hypothetical protein
MGNRFRYSNTSPISWVAILIIEDHPYNSDLTHIAKGDSFYVGPLILDSSLTNRNLSLSCFVTYSDEDGKGKGWSSEVLGVESMK